MLEARRRFIRRDRSVLRSISLSVGIAAAASTLGGIACVAWTWSLLSHPAWATAGRVMLVAGMLILPAGALAALAHGAGTWIRPPRWMARCFLVVVAALAAFGGWTAVCERAGMPDTGFARAMLSDEGSAEHQR